MASSGSKDGEGFCATESDFGSTSQAAKAGFSIEFEEALESDKAFVYVLSGDGDGGDFHVLNQGFIAYDDAGDVFGGFGGERVIGS